MAEPPRTDQGKRRAPAALARAKERAKRKSAAGGRADKKMKFAVIVFPGSNCDHDAYHAATHVLGQSAELIWHKATDLNGADVVVLPGGFAHGDYLRTGAMARFSPIMREVRAFAERG
jgi:hypothetical protein